MKKIICLLMVIGILSTQAFAATYYDVNIEGLTASEKNEVVEWLEDEGFEYDVDSYTSSSSSNNTKELVVEELSTSEKNTLVSWLENRDYDYSTKTKNGDYYVTVEYTSSTKSTLINYLDNKGYEYDSSNNTNSKTKELVVEELSSSQKNTLVSWLENRDYDYSTKTKNGDYYVTIEYTSSNKSTLINYLEDKDYYYDSSNNSNSSDRTGNAYLVANGYLYYADGDDIEIVDTVYMPECVLFTKDGAISYINNSEEGMVIWDIEDATDIDRVASSVRSIETSNGYATYFKRSSNKRYKIENDDYDIDNDEVTIYVVKNNTLYSLSSKNSLSKLKSLKSISNNSYSEKSNIGFSEWGDLVLIDSSGICFFNEEIDDVDEIETLKDQDNRSVKAKYFTVSNGIVKGVVLSDGSTVQLEDE